MAVDPIVNKQLVTPLGILRFGLFNDIGPGWLKFDGVTEYSKAMYPEFVAKAGNASWMLSASKTTLFKLPLVTDGTAIVTNSYSAAAGRMFGADKVTLGINNIPEHDHSYIAATAKTGQGGILGSLITVLSALTTGSAQTGKAGKASPDPISIQPLSFSAYLFIFAGRPKV